LLASALAVGGLYNLQKLDNDAILFDEEDAMIVAALITKDVFEKDTASYAGVVKGVLPLFKTKLKGVYHSHLYPMNIRESTFLIDHVMATLIGKGVLVATLANSNNGDSPYIELRVHNTHLPKDKRHRIDYRRARPGPFPP